MKASFLATATYAGPSGPFAWPTPAGRCDREVAAMSMRRTIEAARLADELGFDWVSLSEHHYAPLMMTPNPLVMAGALSQVLKQARIALLGPLLPLANPVRVAEEIAMVDAMTDGRVIVLFLRGTPNEHHTYGDVAAQSRAMTQEGIQLILKAWTEDEPFAWDGEHFQFKTVSVWPRTRQDPHPPVFGSGNSAESAAFAGRNGLGIGFSFADPEQVKAWIDVYVDEAARAGWTPTPDHLLYRGSAHMAATDAEAEADIARAFAAPGETPRPLAEIAPPNPRGPLAYIRRPYFLGGPQTVLAQVRTLRDCGVGIVDMSFAAGIGKIDYDQQARVMKLFAAEVLPTIRGW